MTVIESASTEAAPAVAAAAETGRVTVFGGLTLGGALFAVFWPVVVIAGYHFGFAKKQDDALAAALQLRPGVYVADVRQFVQAGMNSGLPVTQAIARANQQFLTLGQRGYIVLDSNSVLASPDANSIQATAQAGQGGQTAAPMPPTGTSYPAAGMPPLAPAHASAAYPLPEGG